MAESHTQAGRRAGTHLAVRALPLRSRRGPVVATATSDDTPNPRHSLTRECRGAEPPIVDPVSPLTWQDSRMSASRQDPFADMSRGDLLRTWLVATLLLGPALATIYAVWHWLQPGAGPSWIEGLVQGVLVPPVGFAALALRRRWIRRRKND